MVVIRALRDGNEDEWQRLRFALWPHYALDEMQREMADVRADIEQQPVFVAERPDGGLCGFVEIPIHTSAPGCKTNRIGYLEAWYVDPDYRNQGVGRALVKVGEAWAKSQGCTEMASDTVPEYSISPQAHAALGYQEVERYFRKDLI